MKSSSIF